MENQVGGTLKRFYHTYTQMEGANEEEMGESTEQGSEVAEQRWR